jgi:hypothetical protein
MKNSFIDDYIKKNKNQFAKYKSYIESNAWIHMDVESVLKDEYFNDLYSEDKDKVKKAELKKLMLDLIKRQKETIKAKTDEYKLQYDLVQFVLGRLKTFTTKAVSEKTTKKYKDFIKYCMSIVEIHTSRVEEYLYSIDITKIENQEVRSEEIKLTKECHDGLTKIDEKVTALNLNDEEVISTIEFLNNVKAPLSMHNVLIHLPEYASTIKKALEEKNIDLVSPPKNEMLISIDKVPEWNDRIHYWENSKEALQFYFDEFKKLEKGIIIDGYYISGWMYYHINVFVTPIPQKVYNDKSGLYESKDIIMNPPLRDSDVIIFENHEIQKKNNYLFMFLASTRRAAKTTLESSKLGHAATIGKKELLCAGGSAKDLGQIAKNFKTDIQYKNSAFAVYNVSNDWKDKVQLGLKTKLNKTILLSTLNIVNTDSGNNVEILAGYTPDEFLYDEAMKGSFLETLQGLKPALRGAEGLTRCFGILSATGGDEALSKDGHILLNDPETYSVLPMQWDLLERGVEDEYKTWIDDKRPFGTFIPGQMCVDMPKFESNLASYLGKKDCPNLSKISLKITDWAEAKRRIETSREALLANRLAYMKEVTYIPLKPSDIIASGRVSPFPILEAKKHREHLVKSGIWDRRRELYRDNSGIIRAELSTKDLVEYPHKGGNISAPFLIFEDLPKEKPKYGTYVGAFDDYATDDSATDSVATFYVMKNKILGDPFSEKIVASLSFRPDRHAEVHEKWLMLMEAYNLEQTTFGENFNYAIKDFLDRKHLADKYLAPSLDFTSTFNLPNNLKRKTGWNPSVAKKTLFNLFVDYCNEEIEVEDENGNIIILKGVQRIDDIYLLDEIIQWSEHANVDRITSAMACVAFIHYLQSSFRWKVPVYKKDRQENEQPQKKVERSKTFYAPNNRGRSFYGSRRR